MLRPLPISRPNPADWMRQRRARCGGIPRRRAAPHEASSRSARRAIRSLPMDPAPPPIQVNRAPVLTLWATAVAERLGHPPDTALTLGRFVAGSSARAKARRLGIMDEALDAAERHAHAAALKPHRQTVRLLGRDIPVLVGGDGALRAEDDGKPASARSVQTYIAQAFGDRLGEARAVMEVLAASRCRMARRRCPVETSLYPRREPKPRAT